MNRSQNSKSDPPSTRPPDTVDAFRAAPPNSRRRKWLVRLVGVLFLLTVPLAVLEIALRLAGYGYRTGYFEKIEVGSHRFLFNNEGFSLRFFPPQLARWPVPIMMETPKPAGTCRIFILGESAAMGDPDPACGAGRYLEALLRERHPQTRFEVINTAMTAINSHTILSIAHDCARQQGDFWIIYAGNNEMVGPFGAATVCGSHSPRPLWMIRVNLALRRTRTGQWLAALANKVGGANAPAVWGGMEMFLGHQLAPTDPRKEIVYRHFQRNLRDILRAGRKSGVKIILSTVAVNLKDCPPLASMIDSNLPAADRAVCDRLFAEGVQAEQREDFAMAVQRFSDAAKLDPHRAELQFRWGESLLSLTNPAAAREHFQAACDDDALPFRADSRINERIRQAGREAAGAGVELFDAAAALATNSAAGICGAETFYEHVHFNFDGNYLLARGWAEQIEKLLPASVRSDAASGWATRESCERRLGLPDWNRAFVIQSVIWRLQRPPLSAQFRNSSRVNALENLRLELLRGMDTGAVARTREFHEAAVRLAPDDHFLHENFAKFFESIGDLQSATAEWKRVVEGMPHNCIAFYQVGRLLAAQRQWAEARTNLLAALALRPSMHEGWFQLGNVSLGEKRYELALQEYEQARGLEPLNAIYCVFTGKVLSKLNRRVEAIERYRRALQVQPDSWEAHFALGDELVAGGRIPEAQKEYEEVIRLQPGNAMAHLNVGVALATRGRYEEALRQFEETLRLDPGNAMARVYRDRLLAAKPPAP